MGYSMDLTDIRLQIDEIDAQLIQLLCRRMALACAVADYKAAHHLPVLNQQREQAILDKVREQSGQFGEANAEVFTAIMEASRRIQYQRLSNM